MTAHLYPPTGEAIRADAPLLLWMRYQDYPSVCMFGFLSSFSDPRHSIWLCGLASMVLLVAGCGESSDTSSTVSPPMDGQAYHQGSLLPCQFPLHLQIGEIDDPFQVSRSRVRRALRQAIDVWEATSSIPLFALTDSRGVPVHLRFDKRQRQLRALQAQNEDFEQAGNQIARARENFRQRDQSFQQDWREHEQALQRLNRQIKDFNRRVQRLNQQGGVSPQEKRDLERRQRELRRQEQALQQRSQTLDRRQQELQQQQQRLNQQISRYNQESERFAENFSASIQEAGRYVEHAKTRNGELIEVNDRRIEIFMFADQQSLAWVLAHELGHAIGLGHTKGAGSLMSAQFSVLESIHRPLALSSADRKLLWQRCPQVQG